EKRKHRETERDCHEKYAEHEDEWNEDYRSPCDRPKWPGDRLLLVMIWHDALVHLTTIRRKFVSPISAFTQEGVPIKRKHEFFIIRAGRSEQAEIAGSNPAVDAVAPL